MNSNLLTRALQSIPQQQVDYLAFVENSLMRDGSLAPTFAPPIALLGSFQPVTSTQKLALGLSLKSNYVRFFVAADLLTISSNHANGRANDRIAYQNRTYDITGETDWFYQNGWKELFLTEISAD